MRHTLEYQLHSENERSQVNILPSCEHSAEIAGRNEFLQRLGSISRSAIYSRSCNQEHIMNAQNAHSTLCITLQSRLLAKLRKANSTPRLAADPALVNGFSSDQRIRKQCPALAGISSSSVIVCAFGPVLTCPDISDGCWTRHILSSDAAPLHDYCMRWIGDALDLHALSSLVQWLSSKTSRSWMYSQLLCVHRTCGRRCHLIAGGLSEALLSIHAMTEATISCIFSELSFCLQSPAVSVFRLFITILFARQTCFEIICVWGRIM